MDVKRIIFKYVLPAASIIAAVCVGVFYLASRAGWTSELAGQEDKISSLESQIAAQEGNEEEIVDEIVKSVTALDMRRVESDRQAVSDFMQMVMTWDSYASYKQVREDVMTTYGLGADSSFMRMFLPEIPELIGEDGTSYNIIDTQHIDGTAGYNMTFESAELYVMGMSGDVYTYLAFVTWSTVSGIGYEGMHTDTVRLSVDSRGNVSDLQAYFGMV